MTGAQVTLSGYLTKDFQSREVKLKDGKTTLVFYESTIAVDSGKDDTAYLTLQTTDSSKKEGFGKGSQVVVTGGLKVNVWPDRDYVLSKTYKPSKPEYSKKENPDKTEVKVVIDTMMTQNQLLAMVSGSKV